MAQPETLRTEYEQVNENIRSLADIRFRLVALVPTVGGVAAYLLSKLADKEPYHPLILGISILGFLATLGVTFYDQRNSQLYNALFDRGKALERALDLPDGQFSKRPGRSRRLLFMLVGHDPGLALIYAPVLGAWLFPAVVSGSALLRCTIDVGRTYGLYAAAIVTLVFLEEFLRLDGVWTRLFRRRTDKGAA